MIWPFKRKQETRAAASGFTSEIMAARESYVSGRRGIAELTATAQSCVSLWESGLSMADVTGADVLDRRALAIIGRSLALRGEVVFLIRDHRLIPCSDWDLRTRDGMPTAYRVSISEAGGGRTETALAGEVMHVRIGCDPVAPYYGTAPLKRASLTAGLLNALETALTDVYENAPLGSEIVHLPDSGSGDMADMRASFRGRRGAVMIVEGVAHAVAGGMHPNAGKAPDDLSPDLSKSMTKESLAAARDAINMAFGILPGLANPSTTGPMVREAQRHLAQWVLQPIAAQIAEEASAKLGGTVELDVMRPLQAFDAGGRARAMTAIIKAMAEAKEAGIDPSAALKMVDWQDKVG
jgi:hypothetical protein